MDRFHTAQQSPKNQALYSGNRFSTQHDARQRSPALIVLKEENNNNNNTGLALFYTFLSHICKGLLPMLNNIERNPL